MSTTIEVTPATATPPTAPAGSASGRTPWSRQSKFWLRAAVLASTLAVWWLITGPLAGDNLILSRMGPLDTFTALWALLGKASTYEAIALSLFRLGVGLGIAALLGVIGGLILGTRPKSEYALSPVFQLLRMTSPLAWAPLAIVLFASGNATVISLVALAAVWPVLVGVTSGRRNLDPGVIKVARSLGATRWETLRTTVLPGMLEPVRAALRIALGVGWVVLVPAEMFGGTNGLGYAILNARDNIDYEGLAATMLLIGIVGLLLDRLLTSRVQQP